VDAHLVPMRERRRELARNPHKLQETILHGAQKAIAAAEETMVAVREAIGLLRLGGVEKLAAQDASTAPLRVPESIADAKNDDERWELRTADWLDRVNKTYPLKKDRPRTFITRKGRKVGIRTASEQTEGIWRFELPDRPINVLVLLVQDKDRFLHDYVLPPKILQDYWKKFQRQGDSVEIVLKRDSSGASLVMPENELSIQQYLGDYSALQ
jgi:hypothetical protein